MECFLSANWRYLAMLNFVVDPTILARLVPPGTEIDFETARHSSASSVFFFSTRDSLVCRFVHRDFEEVNLRFYVRKKSADTWRRGVVFVRELFPGALSPPSRGHSMANLIWPCQ